MPVPHPAAVIGQQLANGHTAAPPWQERQRRPAHARHRTASAALPALTVLARGAARNVRRILAHTPGSFGRKGAVSGG